MGTLQELAFWKKALSLRDQASKLARPNIIGVGAGRSGSTSLYHLLKGARDVFMSPIKEIGYFSHHYTSWSLAEYLIFFDGGQSHRYRGEVTPHYLHSEKAPDRIKAVSPDCKIVIQLREPIRRMISHYRHHLSYHKMADINDYIDKGLSAINKNIKGSKFWRPESNLQHSLYYDSVNRYMNVFDKDQMTFILMDDLIDDGDAVCSKLGEWMGIPLDAAGLKRANWSRGETAPSIVSPVNLARLEKLYGEDLARTCALIGRSVEELRA